MVRTLKLSRDVGSLVDDPEGKGQGHEDPKDLGTKKLETWQCLGIGPSNLEKMLVLTSRWHWGQRSWSRSPWPLVLQSL